MNTRKDKRQKLFDLYSQNLEWVKENPIIRFEPDFSNGYICPLCFDIFFEQDLDNSLPNPLTLEDIPPVALGGKPLALTCKKCNSKSGHELDVHLLNRLLEVDVAMFLPNSKSRAVFELNGNKVNGTFEVDEEGVLKLNLQKENSNPQQSDKFTEDLFPHRTIYNPLFTPIEILAKQQYQTPTFNIKLNKKSNERRAEIALLRIAYLIAFSTLGNAFLINSSLCKEREQILNPERRL